MRSAYINDSAGPRLDEASERARARIARHKNETPFFVPSPLKGEITLIRITANSSGKEGGRREGAQHDEETSRVAWRRIPAASLHRGDRFFLGHA